MKPSTSTVALGLLLSLSAPCRLAVAADPGEQILLDRAAYWRAQQRPDMAADMLNKVLALNPSQPDALYQLGMLAAQRGDQAGESPHFARLRQLGWRRPILGLPNCCAPRRLRRRPRRQSATCPTSSPSPPTATT
jgi:cellulose synthase operon protein C